MKWDTLTMSQKQALMKIYVNNGITNLDEIRNHYNRFDEGGKKEDGFYGWIEKLAAKKAKDWGMSEDETLTMMLNDNTYNYREFYNRNREDALKMLTADPNAHFSDIGKTVYHPTFSNESAYSGKVSDYNPRGTVGGDWEGNSYHPSYSQFINNDFDYDKTNRYLKGSGENIPEYYQEIENLAKEDSKRTKYAALTTYYPITSYYPYTGHSDLYVNGILPDPDYDGSAVYGILGIDKMMNHAGYNLVTNNCSDATRCGLEHAFNKNLNTFLFTTPGDVQDWALEELGGIPGIKGDSIFDPFEEKYIKDNRSKEEKKQYKGESTVYIPLSEDQRNRLVEYIYKGKINNEFSDGGFMNMGLFPVEENSEISTSEVVNTPSYTVDQIVDAYINNVMWTMENPNNSGFNKKDKKYYAYADSALPYNWGPGIAYTSNIGSTLDKNSGYTREELNAMIRPELIKQMKEIQKQISEVYGDSAYNMPIGNQLILLDIAHNVSPRDKKLNMPITGWPKLTKALITGDKDSAFANTYSGSQRRQLMRNDLYGLTTLDGFVLKNK